MYYKGTQLSKYKYIKIELRAQLSANETKFSNKNIINLDKEKNLNERVQFKDNIIEK